MAEKVNEERIRFKEQTPESEEEEEEEEQEEKESISKVSLRAHYDAGYNPYLPSFNDKFSQKLKNLYFKDYNPIYPVRQYHKIQKAERRHIERSTTPPPTSNSVASNRGILRKALASKSFSGLCLACQTMKESHDDGYGAQYCLECWIDFRNYCDREGLMDEPYVSIFS